MPVNVRRFVTYLVFSITLLTIGAGFGALALASRVRTGSWSVPTRTDLMWLGNLLHVRADEPSRVVYLDPGRLTIIGGDDDAHLNRSAMVPDGQHVVMPGYTGTAPAWNKIVQCVRDTFADFDVLITDQRPIERGYTLVAVGGSPIDLGLNRERVSGLAAFSGSPIADAIVFAFSATHQNRILDTCETIAHEIGHTYGLDHTFECNDLMTHLTGCGVKRFVDAPTPCGEQSQRLCHDDQPTQSSYRVLMSLLGPREPVVAAVLP